MKDNTYLGKLRAQIPKILNKSKRLFHIYKITDIHDTPHYRIISNLYKLTFSLEEWNELNYRNYIHLKDHLLVVSRYRRLEYEQR